MEQQPELFSTQNFSHSLAQQREQLVMSRQQLIQWKHRIFNHQEKVRQAPSQQETLFDAVPSLPFFKKGCLPFNVPPSALLKGSGFLLKGGGVAVIPSMSRF